MQIHELVAARGEDDGTRGPFLRAYDLAMELYLERSRAEAGRAFAGARELSPRGIDHPCELLGARCEEFLRERPDPDRDGVYTHKSK